jgi:hypothetical protein
MLVTAETKGSQTRWPGRARHAQWLGTQRASIKIEIALSYICSYTHDGVATTEIAVIVLASPSSTARRNTSYNSQRPRRTAAPVKSLCPAGVRKLSIHSHTRTCSGPQLNFWRSPRRARSAGIGETFHPFNIATSLTCSKG